MISLGTDSMQKIYLIIGTSAAGIAAARTLRSLDKQARIICYSDEAEQPYNKCFLADYLHGQKGLAELTICSQEQADELGIELVCGLAVLRIESHNKKVMLANGAEQVYDELLIATGTSPIIPIIKGIETIQNVFAFHGLRDTLRLQAYIQKVQPRNAVVIGAGLSGLEVADALIGHGLSVTVVEQSAQLLTRYLPEPGSNFLVDVMRNRGVRLFLKATVVGFCAKADSTEVTLADGQVFSTDLVVLAIGVNQNKALALQAGCKVGDEGVITDAFLRTSTEHIYAAGDIIAVRDRLSASVLASCTWPDAMQQGMHAAYAMAGKPKEYKGASIIATSAFFGLKFFSCGPQQPENYAVIERLTGGYYHRYLLENDRLKGFCLLGNTQRYHHLRKALLLQDPLDKQLI